MARWRELQNVLDAFASAGRPVDFWWRDDDAAEATGALERLAALARKWALPGALAVIPGRLSEDLPGAFRDYGARLEVFQHGCHHANLAPPEERKRELVEAALEQLVPALREGRDRLAAAFGPRFLPVMVPPWNRIDAAVTAVLPGLGFNGLSTLGDPRITEPLAGLRRIDVHLDLFTWGASKGFRGEAAILEDLSAALELRLAAPREIWAPLGIMTHHLEHDAATWDFLERLFGGLTKHRAARFLSPGALFPSRERIAESGVEKTRLGELA